MPVWLEHGEHAFYGTNSRLDELHAAMLRVKLRLLDARNARRSEIAAFYSDRFASFLTTPPDDSWRTAVYHQYVVRTPQRRRGSPPMASRRRCHARSRRPARSSPCRCSPT